MKALDKQLPVTPLASFLSAVILLCALFYLPPNMDQCYYEYGFFDKEKLLKTVASPRIIVIGGSNATFSFDSKVLKAEMHKNAVNAALHIGFGTQYMLNLSGKYARPGDIILLCPEYEQFYGVFWGNETLVHFLISFPDAWSYVSANLACPLICNARSLLHNKSSRILQELQNRIVTSKPILEPAKPHSTVYRHSALNEDGDIGVVLTHMEKPKDGFWLPRYMNLPERFDESAIGAINDFASAEAKRGVKVVFTYPWVSSSFYKLCWWPMEKLDTKLRSRLRIPIIGSPGNYVLPDECFFDTRYHLLTRYKGLRTRSIVPDLLLIEKSQTVGN